MSFNGAVKEEPSDIEVNNKVIIPCIGIKEEVDYLPDNPDFIEFGNATDGFNSHEWREGCFNVRQNPVQYVASSEPTESAKFNSQNWSNKHVKSFSNKAQIDVVEPINSVKDNNELEGDNSSCEIPPEFETAHLGHFMLDNSEDSTQDTTRTYSVQDWAENKDGTYTCKICKVECSDQMYLQFHFKARRIGDKSYKCCGCDKIFRDNTQLNVHTRKHTGEKPFACSVCGKKFSVNGNLSKHMRIHTGERRFECFTCERKFTQFAHLEDHIKTHSGERPYVCDFCNSAFKTQARLRKHKKSHEDERLTKRSVPCPVCTKVMKSTKQLVTHMETHDEGRHNPFPCETCGKSYRNLFSLHIHLKSHGNVRDFQCTLCDKAFTNASHLRRHSNSHTGIRPYVCNICLRGFPSSQNLKRHLMTHTGEKPYSCEECSRSFLTLENLNRHKRTHTGEKPFPCNVCGRFFAHSTTAKEHMRIHTGDKPFSCTFCNKAFALNKALYKHIREKHPFHFEEFKRQNDLPLNMRRAREKLKRETMLIEETDIKEVVTTPLPPKRPGLRSSSTAKVIDDAQSELPVPVRVKIEPEDLPVKSETGEGDIRPFMETLQLKPVEGENKKSDITEPVFIKQEKEEFDDS